MSTFPFCVYSKTISTKTVNDEKNNGADENFRVIRLVGSSDKHYAIFYISPEDVERLVEGVDKVIINTIPEMYFKSDWSGREKFGITLYEELKKMRAEYCEFDESDEIVK